MENTNVRRMSKSERRKRSSFTFDGTQVSLKQTIRYEPETGKFFRVGKDVEIGLGDHSTYLKIPVGGKTYRAHRLAWLYVYGEWPSKDVDHINGDKRDNRIANLRECTHSQNLMNTGVQSNNKLGIRGVRLRSDGKRYVAQICLNRKLIHIGTYDTAEEAAEAYRIKAIELHKDFTRIK